jgi:hypothetical protein
MGKLVRITDAVMSKRDRNRILRDKMIGQDEVAVVIEEVGEVPRGGRRQRQRLLRARTLHIQMCWTLRSLLGGLASSGAAGTSSGEFRGHFFQVAVVREEPFIQIFGAKYPVTENLVKLVFL